MAELPGRNEPCPCGSGEKYKDCHLGRGVPLTPEKRRARRKKFAIVGVVLALAIGAAMCYTPVVRKLEQRRIDRVIDSYPDKARVKALKDAFDTMSLALYVGTLKGHEGSFAVFSATYTNGPGEPPHPSMLLNPYVLKVMKDDRRLGFILFHEFWHYEQYLRGTAAGLEKPPGFYESLGKTWPGVIYSLALEVEDYVNGCNDVIKWGMEGDEPTCEEVKTQGPKTLIDRVSKEMIEAVPAYVPRVEKEWYSDAIGEGKKYLYKYYNVSQ